MLLANREGSVGGAQRQARLLAVELADRGLATIVVTQAPARGGAGLPVPGGGPRHVRLPQVRGLARPSFLLSFLAWAALNRRRFDVIHAHSTAAGLTAGLVGRLLGTPVVVKVTGMEAVMGLTDPGPGWRLRRWLLDRTADVLVAVSTEMMAALAAAGIPADRRVLIPNGVRIEGPGERTSPARPAGGDGRMVLYVGRLEEVKGVRRLLPAWSALARGAGTTLLVVGDGRLRSTLERDAAARGLNGSVRFLGTRPDVGPFYQSADVFVLPSASEGLSNALLEAMAAGVPAVASNVGGNRDVVEDGVNGLLVDWSDAAAAARAIARLLDDAAFRRRLGEAARRRAADYSLPAVADRYRALYGSLTARHGCHAHG